MNRRKIELNEEQRAELRRLYDNADKPRNQQRLQAVRLYGEGRSVADVQDIVGCSERSLMRWCERYGQQGISGLASGWRGGNHAKLSPVQRAEAIQKIQQYRPSQLLGAEERVRPSDFWTVSDLRLGVQKW